MLEIIITNKPLTEDEWEVFDKDAEWFAYKGSDENLVGNDFHKFMYNFLFVRLMIILYGHR